MPNLSNLLIILDQNRPEMYEVGVHLKFSLITYSFIGSSFMEKSS